ncbi:MAG: aromatic amino acid ammonia-lyase [bacterium]
MGPKTIYDSSKSIYLGSISLSDIFSIIERYFEKTEIQIPQILVDKFVIRKLLKSRKTVDKVNKPVYGVNTGFGKLCNIVIPQQQIEDLQFNLIYSHAAGYGKPYSPLITFLTILIRLNQLCQGYSGVSVEMIEKLIDYIKVELPTIPYYTSVGASGDLIPLSHIFIKFMNYYKPKSKESIAFINGTSFSLSNFIVAIFLLKKLIELSNLTLVLSCLANDVNFSHYSTKLKKTKKNIYFQKVIQDINSQIQRIVFSNEDIKTHGVMGIQAPYCYRCYPQVVESLYLMLDVSTDLANNELSSNTDNPLVIGNDFISSGNFHGNNLSVFSDHLKLHVFQLANLSFHRMNYLLSPNFLILNEGLNSGFMISQYLCSHLLSELKNSCYPLSMENFPVSLNQEDFVSYSENNTRKLIISSYFCSMILTTELMMALQKIKLLNKKIDYKSINVDISKLFDNQIWEAINSLPILEDRDFKKFGSIHSFQNIFIRSSKIVRFIEDGCFV